MKRLIELIKIYIGNEWRNYIYQMLGLFSLLIAFFFFFGGFYELKLQRDYLREINAHQLVRLDIIGLEDKDIIQYSHDFNEAFDGKAEVIGFYRVPIYTKENFKKQRVIIDVKESDFVKNTRLSLDAGQWFDEAGSEGIYPAIVPKLFQEGINWVDNIPLN